MTVATGTQGKIERQGFRTCFDMVAITSHASYRVLQIYKADNPMWTTIELMKRPCLLHIAKTSRSKLGETREGLFFIGGSALDRSSQFPRNKALTMCIG
jgi:hypothetical protein